MVFGTLTSLLTYFFWSGGAGIPMLGLAPVIVAGIIMAAAALAGTGIQAGIAATPTKTEKEMAAQKAQMGKSIAETPGLTTGEREEFAAMGQATVAGAEREYYARASEIAALEGISGTDLAALTAEKQEATERQRADIGAQVRQLEIMKQQQKAAEYRALQQNILNAELARKGGVMGAVQQGTESVQDFATMAMMYEMKYGGGQVPDTSIDEDGF